MLSAWECGGMVAPGDFPRGSLKFRVLPGKSGGWTMSLRTRGLKTLEKKRKEFPDSRVNETNMIFPTRWAMHRCVLVAVLTFLGLVVIKLLIWTESKPVEFQWEFHVSPAHKELVHQHAHRVLEGQCRPSATRRHLVARLPPDSHVTQPFLWRDKPLTDDLFLYPPPFGFRGLRGKVDSLLQLLSASGSAPLHDKISGKCQRCVVMGNGGILKGLELGPLIDRFDIIIRLNRGPLGKFSADVGNRTSIRMSYPEGTPLHWVDRDPHTLFVAVVYKSSDLSWTSAMIKKLNVPLWDWLFFWQKVADHIPLEPSKFRLLNPLVIRETALDLLKYPQPTPRLWGWDQNVPTLGVSALNLASLLCDEVSLAGFGYNSLNQGAPLHYYDHLPLSVMQQQKMHNLDSETQFLWSLVTEGAITDLTGGIHCSFCPS